MSAFLPGQWVLILPEHLPESSLFSAVYGRVTRVTASVVCVSIRQDDLVSAFDTEAPLDACEFFPVTAEEAAVATGLWLRRFVFFPLDNKWVHGQVVDHEPSTSRVTVRTCAGERSVDTADLTCIFPVGMALFYQHPPLRSLSTAVAEIKSRDALIADHDTVLARVLGPDLGSRDIAVLLNGLVSPDLLPDGLFRINFVSPLTGMSCTASIQHVVDFAFFVDGKRRLLRSVRLGDEFCSEPLRESDTPDSRAQDALADVSAPREYPLDPPSAAATLPQAPLFRLRGGDGAMASYLRRSVAVDVDDPACVPGTIRFDPDPVADAPRPNIPLRSPSAPLPRYRELSLSLQRQASSAALEALHEAKRHKYTFCPDRIQIAVHDLLCRHDYRRLPSDVYLARLLADDSLVFLPHPGTLMRLFDFSFGLGGLSILHFVPVSVDVRRRWIESNEVNICNFSVGVTPPAPPGSPSFHDVLGALGMLTDFFRRYGSALAIHFVGEAYTFVHRAQLQFAFEPNDIPFLVYWLNGCFYSLRTAIVTDLSDSAGSTSSPSHEQAWRVFSREGSMQANGFQDLLNNIVMRRSAITLHSSGSKVDGADRPLRVGARIDRAGGALTGPPMPDAVRAAIPKINGLPVCLKYLSKNGCSAAAENGMCGRGNGRRLHHKLSALSPVIKSFIAGRSQWGGLRDDLTDA